MSEVESSLARSFPSLASDGFAKTSEEDDCYNCIAWAAGDTEKWWWPASSYWPDGVQDEETLQAFIAAYETMGYSPCDNGDFELAFEKVVIYCQRGVPTHAARQLDDGAWTSKLGKFWDIRHASPQGVEGPVYGTARQFLKRELPPARVAARSSARSG